MAKILKDTEVLDIVKRIIEGTDIIEDAETYISFLEEVGELVGDYCGAEAGSAGFEDKDYYVAFRLTDSTPEDGGVFKDYDTDVTWKDGVETQ